jgi:carboxymethylenebutenolidase
VSVGVVNTPTTGLVTGSTRISAGEHAFAVYFARPETVGPWPIVLVACEIFGLHEHIRDVCRRLAQAGYLAVAPELFSRHGDAAAYTEVPRLIAEVVSKAADAEVADDLDATLAWAGREGGDLERAAITGFCWGGRTSWVYALHKPRLKAGVAWYGPVARSYHPGDLSVLERAAELQVPMLGLYGADDGGIPPATLRQLQDALEACGHRRSEIVLYPDTPHAFFADYRPSYRPAVAADAWARCLAWLETHLS